MADIELVIKIPEELYEAYKGRQPMLGDAGMDMIAQAIANGTLLPKGHGRIVDIGSYEGMVIASRTYCGVNKLIEVAELDTIIEADKVESEVKNDTD